MGASQRRLSVHLALELITEVTTTARFDPTWKSVNPWPARSQHDAEAAAGGLVRKL
jgi:hypothetical protein